MTRENVMSTPIFDQLLREMAQRAEPRTAPAEQPAAEPEPQPSTGGRRRRAD
jgi:hypothetical protein